MPSLIDLVQILSVMALACLLIAIVASDVVARRASNTLTGAVACLGIACFAAQLPAPDKVMIQAAFTCGTLAFLLAIHSAGWLGGADVKLLAASTLWLAPIQYLTFLFVTAILGGVIAIAMVLACRVGLLSTTQIERGVPYTLAIAPALLCSVLWGLMQG